MGCGANTKAGRTTSQPAIIQANSDALMGGKVRKIYKNKDLPQEVIDGFEKIMRIPRIDPSYRPKKSGLRENAFSGNITNLWGIEKKRMSEIEEGEEIREEKPMEAPWNSIQRPIPVIIQQEDREKTPSESDQSSVKAVESAETPRQVLETSDQPSKEVQFSTDIVASTSRLPVSSGTPPAEKRPETRTLDLHIPYLVPCSSPIPSPSNQMTAEKPGIDSDSSVQPATEIRDQPFTDMDRSMEECSEDDIGGVINETLEAVRISKKKLEAHTE